MNADENASRYAFDIKDGKIQVDFQALAEWAQEELAKSEEREAVLRAERDAALADAAGWKARYEDFVAAIGRHADGITAAIIRARTAQKEAKE